MADHPVNIRTPQGRTLPVGLIVCDLDRTLTDSRLRIVPSAVRALGEARGRGVRIVLATGRTAREVMERGDFVHNFDGVCFEGGALYGTPDDFRPLNPRTEIMDHLDDWLRTKKIDYRRGHLALSIARTDQTKLNRFPSLKQLNVAPNRDRVDVTLKGVNKGTALRRLVREQFPGLKGKRIAFADGENDLPLADAVHYLIAVDNAVDALKARAHEILPHYGGRAVAAYINRHLSYKNGARRTRAT